jgi:hypothetical protein
MVARFGNAGGKSWRATKLIVICHRAICASGLLDPRKQMWMVTFRSVRSITGLYLASLVSG